MTSDGGCSNCAAPVVGRFCPTCGQDTQRELLTLRETLRGIFVEVFEVEASLLGTVRSVLRRPGQKVAEYASGKRRSQFSPTRLYLASAAVYFLVAPLLGDGVIIIQTESGSEAASFVPLTWDSELILLTLVPLWAVVAQGLLIGRKRRFEEFFVFSVHFHVFYLVVLLVTAAAFAVIEALAIRGVAFGLGTAALMAPLPYLWIALRRAFDLGTLRAIATTIALFIAQLVIGGALTDVLSVGG